MDRLRNTETNYYFFYFVLLGRETVGKQVMSSQAADQPSVPLHEAFTDFSS
jgi:hypothetical protein